MRRKILVILILSTLSSVFAIAVSAASRWIRDSNLAVARLNANANDLGGDSAKKPEASSARMSPRSILRVLGVSRAVSFFFFTYLSAGQEQNFLILQGCGFLLLGHFYFKRARRAGHSKQWSPKTGESTSPEGTLIPTTDFTRSVGMMR